MKIIYGWDESYESALVRADSDRLVDRRIKLTESFAVTLSVNEMFSDWLPLQPESGYSVRSSQKYAELPFRTERLRGAPLYRYRRVLNALEKEANDE